MLQLRFNNQQQQHAENSNAIEAAITNALSMNYPNSSGSMALSIQTANALNLKTANLNNNLDTFAKTTANTITQIRHTNGSINSIVNNNLNSSAINDNQNSSSPSSSKKMLKKSHNERKYPCGFPGACFTKPL